MAQDPAAFLNGIDLDLDDLDDENFGVPQQQQQQPEYLQIQGLEDWLRQNGIHQAHDANNVSPPPTLDRIEEKERFRDYEQYEKSVHDAIFANDMKQEELEEKTRQEQLKVWKDCKMDLLTSDGIVVSNVPLQPMAAACEAIFAKASCRFYFESSSSSSSNSSSSSSVMNDDDDNVKKKNLAFSLEEFSACSVADFIGIVMGRHQVEDLKPDSIVDACQIAHYVQNTSVFDAAVHVLIESVDTGNCLSLCYLADKLNIPSLYERSVGHLMQTVGSLESGSEGSCWDDLTPELQERILAIKKAIQSSIHGQRNKLYFSSLDEYIAIFAERCQYYQERLAQAKEEHHNLLVGGGTAQNLLYVQDKIQHQESRVKALKIALAEQKKLFSSARTTT